MIEHREQVSLEQLQARLQKRADKFTPDYIAGIQSRLQVLGTGQGPAVLNPANYRGLAKLRVTLHLGRAREKINEVLPQKSQLVRESVADALTAVRTYQGVTELKAKGYLPEADPQEFNQAVTEAVGKVYKGTIIFPESQPIQKPQPEFYPQPAKAEPASLASPFRSQVLPLLDSFREGSNPYQLLLTISQMAEGFTRDQLMETMYSGDPNKSKQLFGVISQVNKKLSEAGIQIAPVRQQDGIIRYQLVAADQVPFTAKRKKKGVAGEPIS